MKKALFCMVVLCVMAAASVSCSREPGGVSGTPDNAASEQVSVIEAEEAKVTHAADAYMDAWFSYFPEMVTFYRIEGKAHDDLTNNTPEGRRAWALTRWAKIPAYIQNELQNLKDGLAAGYSAPKRNVDLVVEQLAALLAMPPEASPFYAPANAAGTDEFASNWRQLLAGDIYPAIRNYRDFLTREYRNAARDEIAVTRLPNGKACYAAQLRRFTTLPYQPEEMFAAGNEAVEIRERQIVEVGARVYGTSDLAEIRQRMLQDKQNSFESRDEVLAYTTAAVNRAREIMTHWFGQLPANWNSSSSGARWKQSWGMNSISGSFMTGQLAMVQSRSSCCGTRLSSGWKASARNIDA